MTQTTKELYQQFCCQILGHLNDVYHQSWFSTKHGLCVNLANFYKYNKLSPELYLSLRAYQYDIFREYGDIATPFNNGLVSTYFFEQEKYQNELRLKHIKKYAHQL